MRVVPSTRARVRAAAAFAAGTAAALLAMFAFVMLAQISGSVFCLLGAVAVAPVAWALSRRVAASLRRDSVVELDGDDLLLQPARRGDPRRRVPCQSVDAFRVHVRGRSVTLLLRGDWVEHPAGFEAVSVGCDDRAAAEALASELSRALEVRGVAPAEPPCPIPPSAT